jgi:hypothetical protein
MSSFIHLTAKGEHKAGKIGDVSNGVEAMLGKILKRTKDPQLIGSWVWQKYKLFLYGYKEGRAGTENKHDLPPPHDEILLFGDAGVVAYVCERWRKGEIPLTRIATSCDVSLATLQKCLRRLQGYLDDGTK